MRKDAFELAQEHFKDKQPELEVLRLQMEEDAAELILTKAKSKEEGADRMITRNRR